MDPNKLILMLFLLAFPFHSPAQPDVIEKNGNKVQKWELKSTTGFKERRFEYLQLSGSWRIGINILDIVEEASLKKRMLQIEMRSISKITFELLKCNRLIFKMVIEANQTSALFLDGIWMDFLISEGKRRCLREKEEFFLSATATTSLNFTTATVIIKTSRKIRTNPPKDSSKREIIEVDKSDNTYLASLNNVISYARSKSRNGSMIMTFNKLKVDRMSFSKCGLVPKTIEVQKKKVMVVEKDLQEFLYRLSYVFCDYDRNEGRVELNVNCSAPCQGTIRFDYHDYSTLQQKLPPVIISVTIIALIAVVCCRCFFLRSFRKNVAEKTEMSGREAVGIDNRFAEVSLQKIDEESEISRLDGEAQKIDEESEITRSDGEDHKIDKESERERENRVLREAHEILNKRATAKEIENAMKKVYGDYNDATTSQESIRTATRMTNDGYETDRTYESIPDRTENGTAQNKEKEMENRNTPSTSEATSHVTSPKISDAVRWTAGAECVQFIGEDEKIDSIDD